MDASQLWAIISLTSAIVDGIALAGVAWHFRRIIQQSKWLMAIYPLCWMIYSIFAFAYLQIVDGNDAGRQVLRPGVVLFLNTMLLVVIIATVSHRRILTQAKALFEAGQEAQKTADRELRLKQQWIDERAHFLAIISHETRTPVALTTGYLELMAQMIDEIQLDDNEQMQTLKALAQGAFSGAARLKIMLQMSEATNRPPRPRPADLCAIVFKAVSNEDLYTATRREPAETPITVDCGTSLAEVDPEMIETAVFEMVRNALKATPNGWIHVSITKTKAGNIIAVEDNGAGIPASEIERIWEPGRQNGQSHLLRSYEGAGFGLFMVKHIAQLHGGRAALDWTREGKGSRFSIFLPSETR